MRRWLSSPLARVSAVLTIVVAAVAAGIIGAFGPVVLARLPEPAEPADDKALYAELGATPRLGLWLGVTAALAAVVLAARVEPDGLIPVWVLLSGVGAWLAFVDWHTKLLPRLIVNPLNALILGLVAIAAAVEGDWSILVRGLIAAVVVFAFFYLSNFFYREGLGFGDVRLSFGLALALGAVGGAEAFFGIWLGFALGAVFAIVLSRLKIVDVKQFAFGPYLILGAVIAACWAPAFF